METPRTLGSYFDYCKLHFGTTSGATLYFERQVEKEGREDRVEADHDEVLFVINRLNTGKGCM